MADIKIGGGVKECCQKARNLVLRAEDQDVQQSDKLVRRCKVCDCRHIEITVEPGEIGVFGLRV